MTDAETAAVVRDSPWRRQRCHALWREQHGRCFHCGRPMPDPLTQRDRHRKRTDAATIEHVLPRTLGGAAAWRNEVACCRACNAAKADRLPSRIELWRLAWLKREEFAGCDLPEAVADRLKEKAAGP